MRALACVLALGGAATLVRAPTADELQRYPWLSAGARVRSLADAFPAPPGFTRVPVAAGSFGAWLRGLPLRAPGTPVRSFRGDVLHQAADPRVAAVAELDVGTRDLQQCADSVMRLDAEWRFAGGRGDEIRYPIGHGHNLEWGRWSRGERPRVGARDEVTWSPRGRADASHASLRAFMDVVFGWAGTESVSDAATRPARADVRAGDFFIQPGHPGHAVLVLDVVADAHGARRALLGQGYMPAQDFHVLAHDGDPWFSLDGELLQTPFWPAPFPWSSLRRL